MERESRVLGLRAFGPFACFTRPEFKVERVSYEVMTPSAARGAIEAVLWKPAIRWRIDSLLTGGHCWECEAPAEPASQQLFAGSGSSFPPFPQFQTAPAPVLPPGIDQLQQRVGQPFVLGMGPALVIREGHFHSWLLCRSGDG